MQPLIFKIGAFLGSAVVAFALAPLAAALGRRYGVVDHPGGRRLHAEPTSRLGGLSVLAGVLVGVTAYALAFGWGGLGRIVLSEEHLSLLVSCAIIFVLGLVDDLYGTPAMARVFVQAMAAVIVMQAGYLIDEIWTPWGPLPLGLLAYPLTLLWFIGVTNAFNLIDGLDGLLPSVGIASLLGCVGVALSVNMTGTAFLPLALAGALAGFLPWNWHRARVFLGDSGSLLVGFTMAAISLKVARYISGGVGLHVMLFLCALPAGETLLSMLRRYLAGAPIFTGDQSHSHHVLVRKGFSVPKAVGVLALLQVLFSGMAISSRMRLGWYSLVPVAGLLLIAVLSVRWLDYLEFRVAWGKLVRRLSRSSRSAKAEVLGIARAGELIRGASSPEALHDALAGAAQIGGFSYVALEFSDLGTSIVECGRPRGGALNNEAAEYLAGSDGRACWLSSVGPGEQGTARPEGGGIRFAVPLPPEDGRYGRLVCHRQYDLRSVGATAVDVHRYLAEPVAEVMDRLAAEKRIPKE